MRQLLTSFALFAILMVSMLNVWAANSALAQILIENTTNRVLEVLKVDSSSSQIYSLVDEVVLPHFDFIRMSRLVLGKNWRLANPIQKRRFVNEFRELLIRTYSEALIEAAKKIDRIYYSRRNRGAKKTMIRSRVYQKGNSRPIEVHYSMYFYKNKWMVYNVAIGGVSLVINYRKEFANDFRTIGMDGLINKIKNQNQKKS